MILTNYPSPKSTLTLLTEGKIVTKGRGSWSVTHNLNLSMIPTSLTFSGTELTYFQHCESQRNKIVWVNLQFTDCTFPADAANTTHSYSHNGTRWLVPVHGHNSIGWQPDVWESIAVDHRTGKNCCQLLNSFHSSQHSWIYSYWVSSLGSFPHLVSTNLWLGTGTKCCWVHTLSTWYVTVYIVTPFRPVRRHFKTGF